MLNITRLDNGLTVLTDRIEGLRSAALGLWINAGAALETDREHGIAHLLEHMAFKGTDTRSAAQIAEEIENVGGMINAYTGRDQTAYYVRCLSDDKEIAIDILSDILLRPSFEESELTREKEVVIQEIGEAEDMPDDILFDRLQTLSFPDQSLGRTILGTRESVVLFTENDLRNYMSRHYVPKNMIFAAAGDVKHDEIVRLAEKYFTFSGQTPEIVAATPKWGGGTFAIKKDLEQSHIAFALQGAGGRDPDYYVSEVYSALLGGGMSSRLFQEIREKRGLAYSVGSFNTNYADHGVFGVYAGAAPEKTEELLRASVEIIRQTADDVTVIETDRAKAQLRAGLIMGLENPYNRCEAAVRQLFTFGKTATPNELIEKVNAVTTDSVKNFVNRLLCSGAPAICTVGSLSEIPFAQNLFDGNTIH